MKNIVLKLVSTLILRVLKPLLSYIMGIYFANVIFSHILSYKAYFKEYIENIVYYLIINPYSYNYLVNTSRSNVSVSPASSL